MINVFIVKEKYNALMYDTKHHDLPFILEPDKFNIVDDVKLADVIPDLSWRDEPGKRMEDKIKLLGSDFKNQWILRMMHTHATEVSLSSFNMGEKEPWLPYTKNIIVVDINLKNTEEIPYNFLWNRQKAYFVDYDKFDMSGRLWTTRASKKMFMLRPIPSFESDIPKDLKKFLFTGRTSVTRNEEPRNIFRLKLKELVKSADDSFYSDWNPENLNLLWPEEKIFETMEELYENFEGWYPVANEYYVNSFVSAYVETIVNTDNTTHSLLTEKTLDPLIKGHFILPFGYTGMIQDIKDFGFKLPEWIDYSYDKIFNIEERFNAYVDSFLKLRSLDLPKFIEYHNRDRVEILEYNRNLFFTKPYDSLYEKIKKKISITQN